MRGEKLEGPLGCYRRDGIELMTVAIAVENEVVADFDLSTQADVHVVHTLQLVKVEPELRFAQHDELATDILVVPDINETREGAEPVSKRVAPDARQLETIEGTAVGTLEIILVEGLQGQFQAKPPKKACWKRLPMPVCSMVVAPPLYST